VQQEIQKASRQLLEPIRIGDWDLPNRFIMAPLTRCRASEGRVPNPLMAEYYSQRATAGLIISEATSVTPMGVGYPDTPGIWSDSQVEGWKLVTDAVHKAGGRIICQLWHVGRISDPYYLNGEAPVAPSAIRPPGEVSLIRPKKEFVTPRALDLEEIPGVIEAYRVGAENALKAGFDGVEVHGANGYLPDQFLQDSTNHRTDAYGGSIENRARFMLEAVDAAISVWGPGKVGLHIAPRCDSHEMGDSNPAATFDHVAREIGKRKIAFIFAREGMEEPRLGPAIKATSGIPFIANQQLSFEQGESLIQSGEANAISWGVQFIANPDLVKRYAEGAPLNKPNLRTFLGFNMTEKGYTDYPALGD
jgi:2,4-dienoyl-CoA reductase-like NADH-dependent reductase (Old Yellow Enzyme family)